MPEKKIDTVLLAGGINRISLFEGYTPSLKALLSFHDRPSIDFVLAALGQAPQVGQICIVGPERELQPAIREPERYTFVPGGERPGESVFHGLCHFRESAQILFATVDIPLVTPEAIATFLQQSLENRSRGDLFVSAVDHSRFTGPYAGCPKRCTRLRGRSVCHGNLILADPAAVLATISEEQLDTIYRSRKVPLRTAAAFGWKFALAYLMGGGILRFFTLEQAVKAASKHFRLRIVPVLLDHPEIAADIDEAADYAFVQRLLARQAPVP
ncbi:MAG: nucleotidyltransferase family protein [Desulfuromonadales bacterium]|nr:nucleotidyltransferase family protein [Desulfuromonadales bacterium]